MKHTYNIKMSVALWAMLGIAGFAFAPSVAFGGWVGETMCACPGLAKPLGNNATCEDACYGAQSSPGGSTSTPSYDYEAERRAREAEAERQRQQAEAERIERERQAEIKRQKDAAFIRDRDAAAKTLKGSTGPAMDQLKGLSGTDSSGLKGSGFDTGSQLKSAPAAVVDNRNEPAGLGGKSKSKNKSATPKPAPSGDPMVVDARNVPTGLTKALDNAIAIAYSSAPPGVSDRVRKGFQAVMERDWKVAKAWFQDALKLDPNNAGLKRLVALADTSQQPNKQSATVDERNEPAGLGGKSDMKGSSAQPNKTKPALTTDPNLQLPNPDDMYIIFPGSAAMEDKEVPVFKTLPDGRIVQMPQDSDMKLLFDLMFDRNEQPPAKKSRKAK